MLMFILYSYFVQCRICCYLYAVWQFGLQTQKLSNDGHDFLFGEYFLECIEYESLCTIILLPKIPLASRALLDGSLILALEYNT